MQDLPELIDPGRGDNDGIGNDLPTKSVETNPANEPDPTSPEPSMPGAIDRTN